CHDVRPSLSERTHRRAGVRGAARGGGDTLRSADRGVADRMPREWRALLRVRSTRRSALLARRRGRTVDPEVRCRVEALRTEAAAGRRFRSPRLQCRPDSDDTRTFGVWALPSTE